MKFLSNFLPSIFTISLLVIGVFPSCYATTSENGAQKQLLAEGHGIRVTLGEVEAKALKRFKELELERWRFEAQQRKKHHEILQSTLNNMVAEQLLQMEAEARNLSKDELLSVAVHSTVEEPTDEMIESFYQKNKSRLKGDKEKLLPRIKNYLKRQSSQKAYQAFVDSLKEKYSVDTALEPLRFEVEANGYPSLGPADAPVTVVEFSDFQCPYCAKVGHSLKRLSDEYGDKVRVVFRQFPLRSIHPQAQKASEASLCAAEQGKFWELHDAMFAGQKKLSPADLKQTAEQLGLDVEAFGNCLDSGQFADSVERDRQDATRVGVSGTPAFFVNGRPLSGAVPYEDIAKLVEEELNGGEAQPTAH